MPPCQRPLALLRSCNRPIVRNLRSPRITAGFSSWVSTRSSSSSSPPSWSETTPVSPRSLDDLRQDIVNLRLSQEALKVSVDKWEKSIRDETWMLRTIASAFERLKNRKRREPKTDLLKNVLNQGWAEELWWWIKRFVSVNILIVAIVLNVSLWIHWRERFEAWTEDNMKDGRDLPRV